MGSDMFEARQGETEEKTRAASGSGAGSSAPEVKQSAADEKKPAEDAKKPAKKNKKRSKPKTSAKTLPFRRPRNEARPSVDAR